MENIAQDLNSISEVEFNVNKRSIRDRLNLLIDNFKKQNRKNEKASGIHVEETELDKLLEEIIERQHEANSSYEKLSNEKKKSVETEKANAEEQRRKAMESLGETNQRTSRVVDEDEDSPPKKSRKTGSETMAYLREKCENEVELRKQQLEAKKEETSVLREFLKSNVSSQNNSSLQQQFDSMNNLLKTQAQQQQILFTQQQQMQDQYKNILDILQSKK